VDFFVRYRLKNLKKTAGESMRTMKQPVIARHLHSADLLDDTLCSLQSMRNENTASPKNGVNLFSVTVSGSKDGDSVAIPAPRGHLSSGVGAGDASPSMGPVRDPRLSFGIHEETYVLAAFRKKFVGLKGSRGIGEEHRFRGVRYSVLEYACDCSFEPDNPFCPAGNVKPAVRWFMAF
jgi:hypothetical protein